MDNDKQKSAENNASARPGIFSTPDLTVDTEKLAQAAPAADSNKSRIASVFANTDATRQAQQSAITSAPLEGDIVLNGTPKKRSKVPIIVLAIAVILVIAFIVASIIMKNLSSSDSSVDMAIGDIKTKISSYSNLLITGGAESGVPNFRITVDETAIAKIVWNEDMEEKKTFFNRADELISGALVDADAAYSQNQNSNNGIIRGDIMANQAHLKILEEYALTKNIDPLELYLDIGLTKAQDELERNYGSMLKEDANKTLRDIVKAKIEILNTFTSIYDIYESHGCIIGDKAQSECISGIAWDANMFETEQEINSIERQINKNVYQLIYNVLNSGENAYNAVYNEASVEGTEE